jgi:DNA repair exonuclease SbcCD ATPase subunit/DNA repair exonuclease SbcCD nuclease subunit
MVKEILHTNKILKVEKILHIADVHVRNFKRHEEYRGVFERLYEYCREKVKENRNTIIYLAGDIVHAKTDMSPELIDIVTEFLDTLSKIAPTILIAGNHDCNLNNTNRMDALSPIVSFIDGDFNNLFYLKETGIYTLANIDFVLNSVYEDPENFILSKDVVSDRTKIVLFHGAVDMASTDMGMTMHNKNITLEKFKGFDYGMFGDIHKFQYLDTKCKFAYAGSLIQQNFGEGLIHGIIEWDLENEKSKFVRMENDWSYHTVEVNDGIVKSYPTQYSKINCIRLKTSNTSNSDIFNIITELKSKANISDVRVQRISNKLTSQIQSNSNPITDIRDVEQQNKLISDFIKSRYNVSDDILQKISSINRLINTKLSESDIVRNLVWKPVRFEFDNMFSYGEDNTIDFNDMTGVYGLFAPNASGKSSVLDAIMFCIFDKCSRTYKASQVLNNQKETFRCKLELLLAGKTYFIERVGVKDKKGNVKVNVDFWSEDDNGKTVLNAQDRDSTNFVIRKYLGTYDDFIITVMSLQGNNTNFVDKAQKDRKDLLAQFLDLDLFEELNSIASSDVKEVQTLIKEFSKKDYSSKIADSRVKFRDYTKKLDEIYDSKKITNETVEKMNSSLIELGKKIVDVDVDFSLNSIDNLETDLKFDSDKLTKLEKERDSIVEELSSANSMFLKYTKIVEGFDKQDLVNKGNSVDLVRIDIARKESDLRSILSEIKHCESKLDTLSSHEYDPNCKFCINNAFVIDAKQSEIKLKELIIERDSLQKLVIELNDNFKAESKVYSELDNLRKYENDVFFYQKELYNLEKRLSSNKDSINETTDSIKKIQDSINKFKQNEESILSNKKIREDIQAIQDTKFILINSVKIMDEDIITYSSEIKVHEQIIQECEESIKKLKDLEEEFYAYDYYLKAVNRNGVPYQLISEALPRVQNETNTILSNIVDFQVLFDTDGKSINTYIVYDDERFWALELSSGMEKFIASLAIRAALINISSLPRPNFIVIDEGLGTLDSTVLTNFSIFLDYLKTQFQFVIIISHIDVVRDIVDSQIDIRKENGFSSINA